MSSKIAPMPIAGIVPARPSTPKPGILQRVKNFLFTSKPKRTKEMLSDELARVDAEKAVAARAMKDFAQAYEANRLSYNAHQRNMERYELEHDKGHVFGNKKQKLERDDRNKRFEWFIYEDCEAARDKQRVQGALESYVGAQFDHADLEKQERRLREQLSSTLPSAVD